MNYNLYLNVYFHLIVMHNNYFYSYFDFLKYYYLFIFIMSTLAAARADNFYFSKNYDPTKIPPKKSEIQERKPFIRKQGTHIYGKTIRYQTPFHVRCYGCKNMIAKGVRFNAVQKYVANYYTTQIWEFYMKCPQCPMKIIVRTDPQNCDYKYLQGAYRIFKTQDCTDETRIRDPEVAKRIAEDPFFKLENEHIDQQKNEKNLDHIQQLQNVQKRGLDDFQLNRHLRKQIKEMKAQQKQLREYKQSKNIHMHLFDQQQQDQQIADGIKFKTKPIKKEKSKLNKQKSHRDELKQKVSKLHPDFKKILKKQLKEKVTTTSSCFIKK